MWSRAPQSPTTHGDADRPAASGKAGALGNQARLRQLSAAVGLQPKLEVGADDDPLEREADAAADRVMSMPDPGALAISPAPPRLSRKCSGCEDEEGRLLAKAEAGRALRNEAPEAVRAVLADAGRPLDPAARAFFEPRFGRGLSQLRVHDDAEAAHSAEAVGAQAYAVRDHLVFARGRYAPESETGRRLLAHEIAHTLQQAPDTPSPAPSRLRRMPEDEELEEKQGPADEEEAVDQEPDLLGDEAVPAGPAPRPKPEPRPKAKTKRVTIEFNADGEGTLTFGGKSVKCLGAPGVKYPKDITVTGVEGVDKFPVWHSQEYGVDMPWAVKIWGQRGIFIHEMPDNLKENGGPSAGCIHLSAKNAPRFYKWVDGRTRITISYPW